VTTLSATQPREARASASFATAPSGIYAVIVAVFCGLLLISNIAATKTITVVDGLPAFVGGGIFTDGGAFLFPLTYIVGDVLAEVYGLRQAKRAIWVGFALGALASVTFLAAGAAPPGPGYENQEAFVAVLGFVPRIGSPVRRLSRRPDAQRVVVVDRSGRRSAISGRVSSARRLSASWPTPPCSASLPLSVSSRRGAD
jgi:hypothetical protein